LNPKFSVPLISHCPVTMGLQEPAWWAIPEHHTWWDVLYMRTMLPLYCRKASHLFPWSEFNLDETRKYLRLPLENATVTPFAPDASFVQLCDAETLRDFRRSNGLPERYILTVTRVLNLGNQSATFTGTKNVETTLRAFHQIREQVPHKLVIKGRLVREYLQYKGWKDLEGVHFVSQFFPREEIPKLYQSADLCVLPSFYEGCPTTLIEAMACGCAIVASKTSAFPEVGAGAAVFADPYDPLDFAAKMLQILTDEKLRSELGQKSLKRAELFNWERTARLTLEGLQDVVNRSANGIH
jgi:glycosyltransferase involved in cell wall biosynthesis